MQTQDAGWRTSLPWALILGVWTLVSVLATAVAILVSAPFLGGTHAFHRLTGIWVDLLFQLVGIRLQVEGWEQLPEPIRAGRQPVVFMSTHESNLDPPVLIRAIPVQATFISKKELLWAPLVGWAAWVGGTIFLDRGRRDRAKASLKEAARRIHAGRTVVIFPEGTRTRNGALGSFKKGGFALAQDADVPVVPVSTTGGFRILPAGAWRMRPGTYRIAFGTPVHPADHPSREALMEIVHREVVRLREA